MSTNTLVTRVALIVALSCSTLAHADSVNSPNITLDVDANRNTGNGAGNVAVTVNTVTLAEIAPAEYSAGSGEAIALTLRPGLAFDPTSPISAKSATIGINGGALDEDAIFTPTPGTTTIVFELTSGTDDLVQDIIRISGIKLLIAGPEGAVAPALTTLGLTTATAGGAFTDQGIVAASIVKGVADHLAFSTQPGDVQAGASLQPVVRLVDFGGNVVTDDDRNVAVNLQENPGAATLAGITAIPSDAGVAAWADTDLLHVDVAADGYTLRASHDGDPLQTSDTADSEPFAITPGPPGRLEITTQPNDGVAGETLLVAVTAFDALDNVATNGSVDVTLDLATNPTGAQLLGTLVKRTVDGVATWDAAEALRLTVVGAGYTLAASGVGDPIPSDAFAIIPDDASQLRFVQEPIDVTERATLAAPVTVETLDEFGNRATPFEDVALTVSSCTGALVGGSATALDGVATFPDVVIDASCKGAVLTATSSGLVGTRSEPFDVAPAADARPIAVGTFVAKPGKLVKLVAKGVFVLPTKGSIDDPSDGGGSLAITGTTGSVTIDLPASGWKALGPGSDGSKGFRFKGASCPLVVVKQKVVKALCNGSTGTLALPEPGPVEIVLRTGTGSARYCAECGGTVKGNAAKVLKRSACLAPAVCR